MKYKIKFIELYITDKIEFKKKKKAQIKQDFVKLGIPEAGRYNEDIHSELLKM